MSATLRRPTSLAKLNVWHSERISGAEAEPLVDRPQAGWYRRRLSKKGCWVPARIWVRQEVEDDELISDEVFLCEVDGEVRDAAHQWLWLCPEPITEQEFNYLTRLRAWQRVNAPGEWDPTVPVDHTRTPIIEEG